MGMGGGTVLLCTGQDSIWLESWFCYQKYFPKKLNKKKKVPFWSQPTLLGLNSFICLLSLKHSIRITSFLAQTLWIRFHCTQQIVI